MTAPARLAAFAAALGVVFGAAALAGGALGPLRDSTDGHGHPEESDTPGTIRFGAALPSPGRYRLFLQFKHEGRVRTVAHTLEVSR